VATGTQATALLPPWRLSKRSFTLTTASPLEPRRPRAAAGRARERCWANPGNRPIFPPQAMFRLKNWLRFENCSFGPCRSRGTIPHLPSARLASPPLLRLIIDPRWIPSRPVDQVRCPSIGIVKEPSGGAVSAGSRPARRHPGIIRSSQWRPAIFSRDGKGHIRPAQLGHTDRAGGLGSGRSWRRNWPIRRLGFRRQSCRSRDLPSFRDCD
jgi:hypothetical protein